MDELEEARRQVREAAEAHRRAVKRLEDLTANEAQVPDAVAVFLRELSRFLATIPRRKSEGSGVQWFTATQVAALEPSTALANAFRGARIAQGIPAWARERDTFSGKTLGSLLTWICERYATDKPLRCDVAARGAETRHAIGSFAVLRRHDGPRLIRFRVEGSTSAQATIVPLDDAQRKGLRDRAAFLKT